VVGVEVLVPDVLNDILEDIPAVLERENRTESVGGVNGNVDEDEVMRGGYYMSIAVG
jgi:hypothetical protein